MESNEHGMLETPGEAIRRELDRRGWGQDDLAKIINRPAPRITGLIQGKIAVSPEIAAELSAAIGGTAEEWLRREAMYRLSLESADTTLIKRRARLHEIAPVKEMARRGWIDPTFDPEQEILRFYKMHNLDETPEIHGAMRKTSPLAPATPAQIAWAFRVRQLGTAIPDASVGKYDESKFGALAQKLRKLAAYSGEASKVPTVLHSYGIRFVVVEGLAGAKMSGFATWLDEDRPVIGMSIKYNRLDSFWFTLCHEAVHIKHRDIAPVDGDMTYVEDIPLEATPFIERRANEEGAAMLIPPEELQSFINRVGPLYSTERINQFSNRIKMHPNIVVGQLKHRAEILQSAHNKNIVKVRDIVTENAIVDGWGKTINEGAINGQSKETP
jgi:HTH-type transcriptional regulator / antitoxin HigA